MEYYKKDGSGASLIPGRHNIKKYIKDMDARNRQIQESKKRELSNIIQGGILDNKNQMFDDVSIMKSPNEQYRRNWEEIKWKN